MQYSSWSIIRQQADGHALQRLGRRDEHLRHCVAGAARAGEPGEADRMIHEATAAIDRLVKS